MDFVSIVKFEFMYFRSTVIDGWNDGFHVVLIKPMTYTFWMRRTIT